MMTFFHDAERIQQYGSVGTFSNISGYVSEAAGIAAGGVAAGRAIYTRAVARRIGRETGEGVAKWLGRESRPFINPNGDSVFVSKDGLRKIQFHFNKFYPHSAPHIHIEEFAGGKWNIMRIFPPK